MMRLPVTEADLHAYVDGFVSDARREEIDAYLAVRPQELERINTYRAQNDALRALFTPVLHEPIPPRITVAAQPWGERYRRLVAMLVIALMGAVAGWTLHSIKQMPILAQWTRTPVDSAPQVSPLARDAAIAYSVYAPDTDRAVEISTDQEEKLVTWLSRRTGTTLRPPSLMKLNYELIGGRLLPGESERPVAQFMYQDAAGQRLTLYVSTDQMRNDDTGFRRAQQGRVKTFYWIDGRFGYALSGSVDNGDVTRVAYAVYDQLGRKTP